MGFDALGSPLGTCAGAAAYNDCNTGRDAAMNDNSDGKAGFSFTKIAADGSVLPVSAASWSCVKDNVTGLIWENKTVANGALTYTHFDDTSKAQFWNGYTYVNPTQAQIDASTNTVGYKNAVNAASLCGFSDWRLPTADELQGIVDYSVADPGPTIDTTWFPNTAQNAFWSSSPIAGNAYYGSWLVFFDFGVVYGDSRTNYYAVRLVRGGQIVGANRYQLSADGQEVTDTQTNLIWRRCAEGMSWSGGTCSGTTTEYTHGAALIRAASEATSSGKAWRLPNVKELASIVDRSRMNPAIDITAFPGTPSSAFYSSSPYARAYLYTAWFVYFAAGTVDDNFGGLAVRLVRSGQ